MGHLWGLKRRYKELYLNSRYNPGLFWANRHMQVWNEELLGQFLWVSVLFKSSSSRCWDWFRSRSSWGRAVIPVKVKKVQGEQDWGGKSFRIWWSDTYESKKRRLWDLEESQIAIHIWKSLAQSIRKFHSKYWIIDESPALGKIGQFFSSTTAQPLAYQEEHGLGLKA